MACSHFFHKLFVVDNAKEFFMPVHNVPFVGKKGGTGVMNNMILRLAVCQNND